MRIKANPRKCAGKKELHQQRPLTRRDTLQIILWLYNTNGEHATNREKNEKKGKYKRETGVRMVKLMDALLPYIFYEKSETHAYFFEATTESERTLYIPSLQCFRSRLSGHSYVCIEEKVYSYPWVEPLYVVFFSIRRTYVL